MNHYPQQFQSIQVNCYFSHSYADHPTSCILNKELHEITRIEREWLEPAQKHFIVQATRVEIPHSEKRFEICYDTQEDIWRLNEIQ